jgi:hypothetical protein
MANVLSWEKWKGQYPSKKHTTLAFKGWHKAEAKRWLAFLGR